MQSAPNNPIENKLSQGITDLDVDNAVRKSGYPLQTIISNKLRDKFYCQEEWSFIDSKTKEVRTLDIMAQMELFEHTKKQLRVRPTLNLLIECKQSELPYVFFLSPSKLHTYDYPYISGLFHKDISISSDDDPSTWNVPLVHALGLEKEPFLNGMDYNSMTFSKCVRNGKEIALSGTEAYQGLVLPLIKSLQYFEESERPPKTAHYFDGHLPFAIGVIDGPMVGITVEEKLHSSELIPWVRVFRHESYESDDWTKRRKVFAVDIVHKDYFDSFISDHLLPFVNKYSELMIKHETKVAEGKAFAKGMGKNCWTGIEERLQKYSIAKKRILPKI